MKKKILTMKKKMLTKSEKAAVVKAAGKIAALEFVAHKIALGYVRQITLAQNEAVVDMCIAVARLRSEFMGALLTNEHRWGIRYEALDDASVAACVAEISRHKAYTAKRMLAMLDELEGIEVADMTLLDFLNIDDIYLLARVAVNDLAEFED